MSEEKYVVLRPIVFGAIGKSLRPGDQLVHDESKRQVMINGEGPFPDRDIRGVKALEERAGKQFIAIDNSGNRKKAKEIAEQTDRLNRSIEDKSIYEAEKFDVVSEEGFVVQDLSEDAEKDVGHKYPRAAKREAKDPGKPNAVKIGGEGSFREDLAYKEGIETDFPIVQDNSSVAVIDSTAKPLNAGKKPSMSAAEKTAAAQRRKPGRPKKGRKDA